MGAPKEKPPAVEPSEKPEGAAEPIGGREKEKPVVDAEVGGADEAAGGGAVKDNVAGGGAVPEDAEKDGKMEDAAETGAAEKDDSETKNALKSHDWSWRENTASVLQQN